MRAESILACKPRKPGESPAEQVHWLGEGNQYDIHDSLGPSWIVLSAKEGTQALSVGATDLNSWLRLFPTDKNPIPAKLEYQIDPGSRSNPLRPGDFAIGASGPPESRPGADPSQVGPWSSPR